MKKSLIINLSMLLLLPPALSFAQSETVSGTQSCWPYTSVAAPGNNTYTYTLNYTPPDGYSLSSVTWMAIFGYSYQSNIYDLNGIATKTVIGWSMGTDNDRIIKASVLYTKAGANNITRLSEELEVTVLNVAQPGSITGSTTIPCLSTTQLTYSVTAVANADKYNWTFPTGWVKQNPQNGNVITVTPNQFNPTTADGEVSVTAENVAHGVPPSLPSKKIIKRRAPDAPSFINPTLSICAVSIPGSAEYNITTVTGATSYSWDGTDFGRFPPTGTSANAFFWNAGAYTLSASAVNACGTGPSSSINVKVSTNVTAEPGTVYYERVGNSCYYSPFVSAISGAFSYDWSLDNFSTIYCTSTLPDDVTCMLLDPSTTYAVSVRTNNSCGASEHSTTTIETPPAAPDCIWKTTSISSQTAEHKESFIYPNPAHTSFEISLPDNKNFVKIKMINMEGQVIKDFSTDNSKIIVQTSDIPAGLYIINITSDNLNTVNKIQIVK